MATVRLWAFGSAYAVAAAVMYMTGFLLNKNYEAERRARMRLGLVPDGEGLPLYVLILRFSIV